MTSFPSQIAPASAYEEEQDNKFQKFQQLVALQQQNESMLQMIRGLVPDHERRINVLSIEFDDDGSPKRPKTVTRSHQVTQVAALLCEFSSQHQEALPSLEQIETMSPEEESRYVDRLICNAHETADKLRKCLNALKQDAQDMDSIVKQEIETKMPKVFCSSMNEEVNTLSPEQQQQWLLQEKDSWSSTESSSM